MIVSSLSQYYNAIRKSKTKYLWFFLLILTRPVLDTLYELKNINVFFSPLYWIGIITPFAVAASLLALKPPYIRERGIDVLLNIFIAVIALNVIVILITGGLNVESLQTVLKISLFPAVYIYARRAISSQIYFDMVMWSFAVGSLFVYGMIYYEQIFGVISSKTTTGGIEVASGLYADSVSYGMYINISLISWGYIFYDMGRRYALLAIVIVVGAIVGLISIGHIASLACSGLIMGYYIMKRLRQSKIASVMMVVLFAGSIYYGFIEEFESQYAPKVVREMEVFRGDRDAAQGFHGRVTRWTDFMSAWVTYSLISKFFGVSLMVESKVRHAAWLLITPHNDYLRIMFMSGIFGLTLYMFVLIGTFYRSGRFDGRNGFALRAALMMIMIYSFTTLPSLYPQTVYFMASVVAFTVIGERKTFVNNKHVMSV